MLDNYIIYIYYNVLTAPNKAKPDPTAITVGIMLNLPAWKLKHKINNMT